MKAAKLEASHVTFQFPEPDLTNYLSLAAEFSNKVRKLGCRMAVNRFGGSLDPFKLFTHVDIDLVKFDGTYTQDLGNKESKDKFSKMIIRASEEGKQVLVGFVESANQMQTLWTMNGVNFLQGYYLQPPTETLHIADGE